MIVRSLAVFALAASSSFGAYTYYYTDALASINNAEWQTVGTIAASATGVTSSDAVGGSVISKRAVPDGSSEYEVKTNFRIASSGGTYTLYLRASLDALSSHVPSGTYYSVELQNPVVTPQGCNGTLVVYKRVGGIMTTLMVMAAPCRDGMEMRVVVRNDLISIEIDGLWWNWVAESAVTAGQPGVGMRQAPAGNSISLVSLGPLDRTPPAAIPITDIAVTAFANSVEIQWKPPVDDANGTGVIRYDVLRSGRSWGAGDRGTQYTDAVVSPSTAYSYAVYAIDRHFNYSVGTGFAVQTAPAGSLNPRQTGIRPEGTYWGGAGEQVNMQSGNVNFTLPVMAVKGRAGVGTTFALSYNSQQWRRDLAGTWNYGRDTGFGYGWKMQAGAITPFYSDYWTIDHFKFYDSTGAEYRLDLNSNGLWTSREGIYLTYDQVSQRLYFPDGTFWVMGCLSGGAEQDAGTYYPTIMQDTNGNQVRIDYSVGASLWYPNSSARPSFVWDGRSPGSATPTYQFVYTPDSHLELIHRISPGGLSVGFTYSQPLTITDPWAGGVFGAARLLVSTSRTEGGSHSFEYSGTATTTSGELQRVTLPYGGKIRWAYRDFMYAGSRTVREVQQRYLQKDAAAAETMHSFWHDDAAAAGLSAHSASKVYDSTGQRLWNFNPDRTVTSMQQMNAAGVARRRTDYVWTFGDPATQANPYISKTTSSLYGSTGGTGPAVISIAEQTLDAYGNVKTTKQTDSAGGNPRITTYSYLHETGVNASQYISRYIRNRLTGVSVNGGQVFTPFAATYDSAVITTAQQPSTVFLHDTTNYGAGL